MGITCWAPDCYHNNMRETCTFYRFPKEMKTFRKWLTLLRRNAKPGPGARVCSCHFRDSLKDNLPEIFEHSKKTLFEEHHLTPEKKPRTARKKRVRQPNLSAQIEEVVLEEPDAGDDDVIEEIVIPHDITSEEPVEPQPSTSQASVVMLEAENYLLKSEVQKKAEIIKTLQIRMPYTNISESDKLVLEYTGIPTASIFEGLYTLVENVDISYYLKWNVQKLDRKDQLLMTLMKMRQNFTHVDLAFRFQVSEATVTNVVVTFIHVLHEILHHKLMEKIPSRQKNKSCLPNCASSFTNCRIILDCTDVFCAVPRQSMKAQRETYSTYKHHNTFKGLVGAAPNGVITFISKLYPGCTSDKNIVKHSKILEQMEAGDLILADKGFLISDLLPSGVTLNIPPFLSTPQFTKEQIEQTRCIARARIHIERAIRRMKSYKILSNIPESLFQYASCIFQTVGALTNLQYPLINEVAELYVSESVLDD